MKMSEQNNASVVVAPEIKRGWFLANWVSGFWSLLKGMKVTGHYFFRPSTVITQQYPENRATLKMFERFRGQLALIHDENQYHKCTGCQICQEACPNGSIVISTRANPVNGKKELDRYIWRMDSCTFCNSCVQVCPFGALKMENGFEHAVYDRRLFVYTLNHFAGPTIQQLGKVTDPEERKKMLDVRKRYEGDVPLAGVSIAGLAGLKASERKE